MKSIQANHHRDLGYIIIYATQRYQKKKCINWSISSKGAWSNKKYSNPHMLCCKETSLCVPANFGVLTRIHSKIDLRFLRVCRQIYEEANTTVYTSNIFSFDCFLALRIFIDQKIFQNTNIRKLRLEIEDFGMGTIGFHTKSMRAINLRYAACKFRNLEQLHVDVVHKYTRNHPYCAPVDDQGKLKKAFESLSDLSLRIVTVVVSEPDGDNTPHVSESELMRRGKWTWAQKQEW